MIFETFGGNLSSVKSYNYYFFVLMQLKHFLPQIAYHITLNCQMVFKNVCLTQVAGGYKHTAENILHLSTKLLHLENVEIHYITP